MRNALLPEKFVTQQLNQFQLAKPYAQQLPSYQMNLYPKEEAQFRAWVQQNKVPFNPDDPRADYDMRAYWLAHQAGQAEGTSINPNDGLPHYPDTYKTPYHKSFSNESMYATPDAPRWVNDHQLAMPDGSVVFDERAQK